MTTKKTLLKNINTKMNYLEETDIRDGINLIIDYLTQSLKDNNRIEIRGFGSFSIKLRKYAKMDNFYNTVYYRMAKAIADDLSGKQ